MIRGHVLDYGCGKCAKVNQTMLWWKSPKIKSVTSYDPHYEPLALANSPRRVWDTVLCTYVLCTLPETQELDVLLEVQKRLAENGVGYITVRADKPRSGYGVSSKGTFQRNVELPFLKLIKETSRYRIYLLTRETNLV